MLFELLRYLHIYVVVLSFLMKFNELIIMVKNLGDGSSYCDLRAGCLCFFV